MTKSGYFRIWLLGTAGACGLIGSSFATNFDVPGGSLEAALNAYSTQSGVQLMIPVDSIGGIHSRGAKGDLSAPDALSRILSGTGFTARRDNSGVIGIVPEAHSQVDVTPIQMAQAAPPRSTVETVTVTSSKLGGADVQSIPIAITALSQEQLTATQTAGGPDLVKQVPNLTFTKTNFTGYSIQIRGIGTQAISVATDPAVAVALNDIPFIRNHFFEQEFFDLSQAEVLRGPQGTLYGRNATAGVVNLITAKPTDQFEAQASADIGNYKNRRFEGMLNLPIVDDRFDMRIAGEWTKRDGYSTNELTGNPIDGRDLWSSRVSAVWKPTPDVKATLVWEHFSENDDRMRTAKQLCKTAPNPTTIGNASIEPGFGAVPYLPEYYLNQGCLPSGLYSPDAFGVPNGLSLPYASAIGVLIVPVRQAFDPYASTTQSNDLRVIESQIDPRYRAKNDTVELNADYDIASALTLTSQTGYNNDFLWSTEDYNRFNTAPGMFVYTPPTDSPTNPNNLKELTLSPLAGQNGVPADAGVFCDPQIGCSDRLVAQDLSDEHAWQLSQEFRLASHFSGPLNFSVGGNYLHYETEENYYVFVNSLTLMGASAQLSGGARSQWIPGVSDNHDCLKGGFVDVDPFVPHDPQTNGCFYIDPNPLTNLNNEGHNYFLSQNPYILNSYAGFGEAYYTVAPDLKLTGGLRWTDDQKHFVDIPSELVIAGYGYPATGVIDQGWDEWTGRFAANWTPKLDFTDQTLIYGSFAHGYKAGGANPPGATLLTFFDGEIGNPIHPATFKPEFINAYELGTKNTMLDGGLTLNGDVFFYDYKGYQISRIVDRTAINDNFDATVKGAEVEAIYEPLPGLRFKFAGGYEKSRIDNGQSSIDLIDRADLASHPDWMVLKPFVTQASNCVLPAYVVAALITQLEEHPGIQTSVAKACGVAYNLHLDPVTAFDQPAPAGYPGFDPVNPTASNNGAGPAPNNGEGFAKDLGGNELPNAPHFTVSASADYTIPVTPEWASTLHVDYYWQDYSWARVFNDNPYDRLRGYTSVNFALILTNQDGWQVMGYVKNVFDVTDITGTFLNSDDSGLTTNVFLTDPRLFGVRVTKNW